VSDHFTHSSTGDTASPDGRSRQRPLARHDGHVLWSALVVGARVPTPAPGALPATLSEREVPREQAGKRVVSETRTLMHLNR